jgi:predicted nucleotidyltransferase component of viral defense system
MIERRIIDKKASEFRIPATQIEKDYVLSWLLAGIYQNPMLAQRLAFKGGTVLKRAYFNHYRFSEDLDFTLLGECANEELFEGFEQVFDWLRAEAAIGMTRSQPQVHQASQSISFHAIYRGPLGGNGRELKVDITRGEKLEFEPVLRPLLVDYPDLPQVQLKCYPLEEVLIEKCCAIMGRLQPRDLYDVWYLFAEQGMKLERVWTEFSSKALHKRLDPSQLGPKAEARFRQYRHLWEQYLAHQISDLPHFDEVVREVQRHLRMAA